MKKLQCYNYVRKLSDNILDSVANIFGERNHPSVLQHDTASVHRARRTVAWLEQQHIFTIQWLSQSLDLINIKFGISSVVKLLQACLSRERIWPELYTLPIWISQKSKGSYGSMFLPESVYVQWKSWHIVYHAVFVNIKDKYQTYNICYFERCSKCCF